METKERTEIRVLMFKIDMRLRGIALSGNNFQYVYAAYLCGKYNLRTVSQFQKFTSEMSDDRQFFLSTINFEDWESIVDLNNEFGVTLLAEYLVNYEGSLPDALYYVPAELGKLALRILDINESDHVADFGGGFSNSLTTVNTKPYPYGIVTSVEAKERILIKNELLQRHVQVDCGKLFKIDKSFTFDKILAESPIGFRPLKSSASNVGFDRIMVSVPGMEKAVSYFWLVAALMVEHLNKNGKAGLLVSLGSLSNSTEEEVRKYFIQKTLAVIALGPKLLPGIQVPMAFIVLGTNTKGSIRMIDARRILVEERRQNYLSDNNIDIIVDALTKDSDITTDTSFEELEKNNYSFNPEVYVNKVTINNGVQLKDVTIDITRGMPLSAGKLDGLISDTPTGIQYLQLSDIQDGMIRSDLPYLKSMDKEYENYTIKRDCIILSRTGSPVFKMAVADFETDARVIGSGNLYIIELDQEKMNPYFLKAFLESRDGQLSLKRISAGSVLENISIKALKTLEVPCPAMSEQNRIAEEYKKKEDAVRALSKQLDEAKQALKNVYKSGE